MIRRLAPYLALGPLTGPLAYGCVRCLQAHRWTMAGVYAAGVIEVVLGLPVIAALLLRQL